MLGPATTNNLRRSASATRLATQFQLLNERSPSQAGMDDLDVGDVFCPQTVDGTGPKVSGETGFRLEPAEDEPIAARPQVKLTMEEKKKLRRKKKNKHADGGVVEVGHDTPALSTVRGFNLAPSGDEDSDRSTPAGSRAISPRLPPTSANNGVSALKLQIDALSLSESRASSRTTTMRDSGLASDADSEQTETYEVDLVDDFVSQEAVEEEHSSYLERGGADMMRSDDNVCRKMSSKDFEPLTCLGKGTFGTVLLVRHKATGRLYAQKQLRKASITVHKKLVEQTKTERMILESVNRHPFVVKLYYAFQDHEKLYLILEYAQGGELFTHLAAERMFSEDVAAFYMAEMVLALEHLHQNVGVIYRDLKPENCLLDAEGHLLLTDFGLSKVAVNEDDRCNSSLGTIEYMAPEVIQGKPYGKACDWWSLGALGFDLLTGSPPFKANNNAKIKEKIVHQKLNLPYYLGPDAKDLLTRLLRKEPHKRLGYHGSKDIETIKKHRFFRKIDWKALARREVEPPIRPLITDPALAENFSAEFTSLRLSAIDADPKMKKVKREKIEEDPFQGFSFVASSSLLNETVFVMSETR
ncbi:hypothetical protein VTN49DRAFT_6764 [Thermomyces lanuginosus]|uniref:uncharacterized protein n=1 Tax=Thermomyces lanuginosus TaxID=5541 RepID=UPI00374407E0